jgi:hypothetical protein
MPDEEEEEVVEEKVEQSIDGQYGTSFESTSSAAMFSKITEMSRQLAEMMEMHRKQQLMAKKKNCMRSDSPPLAKSRKLKSPFTPTRTAADIIGATQADEDFERDSLASQSSRTTAFVSRRNMSKLPHCTRTNALQRKSRSASAK